MIFLSALLLLFASPGPTNTGAIVWIALVPLLFVVCRQDTTPLKAAAAGLFCGLLYYTALLSWIMIVLGNYGEMPIWISLPVLLILALYMSIYPAIFSFLTNKFQNRFTIIWTAPVIWVGLDWLKSIAFTGFPWMDLAYTQFRTPLLMQSADLAGHHGVTFLIVLVNCLLFSTISSRFRKTGRSLKSLKPAFLALLLIASCLAYDFFRFHQLEEIVAHADRMNVAVVQGNIDQGQKWLPSLQRKTLNKYLELSRDIVAEEKPELIIWPETAMPFYLQESKHLDRIRALGLTEESPFVLTGAPYREAAPLTGKPLYFNSAFLIPGGEERLLRYDKQHLVPFGEYVPLKRLLPFLAPFVEAIADFSPGKTTIPLPCHDGRVGVLICFESIFPALARSQTIAGANLLVNLTNDAWYGRSGAPWQHLAMVVLRAVENRRSLARSANTGVSGFIDPLGRIAHESPLFEDFTAGRQMVLLEERSFFTFGIGCYFGLFCLLVMLILTFISYKIPARSGKGDAHVN